MFCNGMWCSLADGNFVNLKKPWLSSPIGDNLVDMQREIHRSFYVRKMQLVFVKFMFTFYVTDYVIHKELNSFYATKLHFFCFFFLIPLVQELSSILPRKRSKPSSFG
jgi:hypothetical protein